MTKKITTILIIWGLLFISASVFAQKNTNSNPLINDKDLKTYMDFIASDAMRGRSTPSLELNKAADYIAGEFKKFGLKPVNNSYFQSVDFCAADLNIPNCTFAMTKDGKTTDYVLKTDYTPTFETGSGEISSQVIFAGYGITAPEFKYDDYAGIDVKGKIVFILKHEPRENEDCKEFDGKDLSDYGSVEYKIKNAQEHGAAGVILATDPLNHLTITAQGYIWKSLYFPNSFKKFFKICTPNNSQKEIPVVVVNDKVVEAFFGSVDALKKIQEQIDKELKPNSFLLNEISSVKLGVSVNKEIFPSSNVLGIIEGKHPELKNEYIVVGAHYDHVGVTTKPENNDFIMNGADDNASGTVGVMALAKAFSQSTVKPDRGILFMLFTGEEKGLLGSEFYAEHPILPLDKTVAMINLDMIGRNDGDAVYVEGVKQNPELSKIAIDLVKKAGLQQATMDRDMYMQSDHYSFYKNGVSAIGFTSGLHPDYHQVRDNPDKINYDKLHKITQLSYYTIEKIANQKIYFDIKKK